MNMKTVLLAAALTLASTPAPAAELAVYKGAGCEGRGRLPGFEAWLGRPVDRVIDFLARDSWDKLLSSARWISGCWRDRGARLSLAVPMLPNGKDVSLAAAASGTYDATFRELARILIADGHNEAVIRLGWEFNGGWYPWAAKRDPEAWAGAWRRIVAAMRSVEGARFRFDWNPTLGWQQIPPDRLYPGDEWVDVIGLDVYNQTWKEGVRTPEERWWDLRDQPFGLAWHARFAKEHGKPLSFPEWGTGTRPDGHGAGDDPLFVERMADWMAALPVLYQGYWDYPAPDFNAEISQGRQPEAAAAFLERFGGK
jgi:hypothetical protein